MRPWTPFGKGADLEAGFGGSALDAVGIVLVEVGQQTPPQARAIAESTKDLEALSHDRGPPRARTLARVQLPFQKMGNQHRPIP
jgi:hypothetical protein